MKIYPIPSHKLVLLVRYFHFSLGIFLLLSTLLLNGCSSTNATVIELNWQNANKAPHSLLQLAISENTSLPPGTENSIKVAAIPIPEQNKRLYFFNYNSPNLCGKLGCLYTGYLDKSPGKYSRVINLYLQPDLPPKEQLISLSQQNSTNISTLPCLNVQQMNSKQTLQKLTYCFDGNYYHPIESTLFKLPAK